MPRKSPALLLCAALITAFLGVANPARASATVINVDGPGTIPGQYIVAVQAAAVTGSTPLAAVAQSLASTYGGTVGAVGTSLNMFSLSSTDSGAGNMAADSRVLEVEADQQASPVGVETTPPWGLDRIDQCALPVDQSYGYVPGKATVYVVDSGIRTSNSDFGGRARYGYNALDGTYSAPDCTTDGHGTNVASVIAGATYGVDKAASVVAVKVFPCVGGVPAPAPEGTVVKALDWIASNALIPSVVNLSIGTPNPDPETALAMNAKLSLWGAIAHPEARSTRRRFPGSHGSGRSPGVGERPEHG